GPDPANPFLQQWGNTPNDNPPGTQTYGGQPLDGTNYSVQAWFSLTPVAEPFALATNARPVDGSLLGFFIAGRFGARDPVIPEAIVNFTNGLYPYWAYLQVRAWDNAGGQLASWDSAWSAAQNGSGRAVGWSEVFFQPLEVALVPWPGIINFESFNTFVVPEPASTGLLAL